MAAYVQCSIMRDAMYNIQEKVCPNHQLFSAKFIDIIARFYFAMYTNSLNFKVKVIVHVTSGRLLVL